MGDMTGRVVRGKARETFIVCSTSIILYIYEVMPLKNDKQKRDRLTFYVLLSSLWQE